MQRGRGGLQRLSVRQQRGQVLIDKQGVQPVGGKARVAQHRLQHGDVGGHAADAELPQRPHGLAGQRGQIIARQVDDHLGDQGVKTRAGAVAGIAEGIDPDARPARWLEGGQHAAAGPRGAVGGQGFQVDAGLQRQAARRGDGGLVQAQIGQAGTGCNAQLQRHQVQAGDGLGHRVLHLQPGIGLDKSPVG